MRGDHLSSRHSEPRGTVRVVIDFDREDYEALERLARYMNSRVERVVERAAMLAVSTARFWGAVSGK